MNPFNPISDMPRTKEEALQVLASWGDGGMAFTNSRAARCYNLLSGKMPEFIHENRYLVVKRADVENALSLPERRALSDLCTQVSLYRGRVGKPPLECVVVESDWPEYELVWRMIEKRTMAANLSGTNSGGPGAGHVHLR